MVGCTARAPAPNPADSSGTPAVVSSSTAVHATLHPELGTAGHPPLIDTSAAAGRPGGAGRPVVQERGDTAGDTAATRVADSTRIAALEKRAVALASTSGCATIGDCRVAPVGAKACGGPQYYIPYCARTTDSVALFRALDALADAERAYNKRYHVMSTCMLVQAPTPTLRGGRCALP